MLKTFVTLQGRAEHTCCRIQMSSLHDSPCPRRHCKVEDGGWLWQIGFWFGWWCRKGFIPLCLKRPPGFWRLSKSLQLVRSEAVFFNIRIPFLWCNGWELLFWTHWEAICVLDYDARVTFCGFRPSLLGCSWEWCRIALQAVECCILIL